MRRKKTDKVKVKKTKTKNVNPTRESYIQREILDWLESGNYLHWRNNSGVLYVRGRKITLAPKGSPDIVVVYSGTPIGLEVKRMTPRTKLNPEQKIQKQRWLWAGAEYFVVRSLEEARRAIETGQGERE